MRTEVVKNNVNPRWRAIQVTLQQLSNSDPYRPLLLECFDWNASGSHELIGQAQASLDDLMKLWVLCCVV
jgi:Ca2+-dependent lipid-binding protein